MTELFEFLRWIFESFWRWLGFLLLLTVFANAAWSALVTLGRAVRGK